MAEPAVADRGPGALHVDAYEVAMMAAALHQQVARKKVSFELFVRHLPPTRRFLVACGIQRAVRQVQALRFEDDELEHLAGRPYLQPVWTPQVEQFLRRLRFEGDVFAVPEGSVVFQNEPLLRVTGRLAECLWLETLLLSVIHTETLVASTAARICGAAGATAVLEFGSRRTSPEEGLRSSRAAYVGGVEKTSNLRAGRLFDIPTAGTMAHAWVMAFEDEVQAFRSYVDAFGPEASTLVVDTYDTYQGVENALTAAGPGLGAVRLDSGDLSRLSRRTRAQLDRAGAHSTRILVSGDLTAERIQALRREGAPIDGFGVGTGLVRSVDAPSLSAVYKLVWDHDREVPVRKTSEAKASWPGVHQILRHFAEGRARSDRVCLDSEAPEGGLLRPVLRSGRPVAEEESLTQIRSRSQTERGRLPSSLFELEPVAEPIYPVEPSEAVRAFLETHV